MRRFQFLALSIGLSLLEQACAPGEGVQEKSLKTFESRYLPNIEQAFKERLDQGAYQHIFHMHFNGNDLGLTSEHKTELIPADQKAIYDHDKNFELPFTQLPSEDAAYDTKFDYPSAKMIGSLRYRYTGKEKALRASVALFQCQAGQSPLLSETLFIGSGGSHGGKELEDYSAEMQKLCGKKIDLAVLGDAIRKPSAAPMKTFAGLAAGGTCLQVWQTNSFLILNGALLEPCYNVHIKQTNHGEIADYPYLLVEKIVSTIQN